MITVRPRGKAKRWTRTQLAARARISGADLVAAQRMVQRASPKLAQLLKARTK